MNYGHIATLVPLTALPEGEMMAVVDPQGMSFGVYCRSNQLAGTGKGNRQLPEVSYSRTDER